MNKSMRIRLAFVGVSFAVGVAEGYLVNKAKREEKKKVESIVNEVRDEMNTVSEVTDPETGASSKIEQGVIGEDEYGKPIQGLKLSVQGGVDLETNQIKTYELELLDSAISNLSRELSELQTRVSKLEMITLKRGRNSVHI